MDIFVLFGLSQSYSTIGIVVSYEASLSRGAWIGVSPYATGVPPSPPYPKFKVRTLQVLILKSFDILSWTIENVFEKKDFVLK